MKFFKQYKMDHGGVLYDNGDNTTSEPELGRLEVSRKMNRDKVGRIFAAFTRPEEEALEQIINNNNYVPGKKQQPRPNH